MTFARTARLSAAAAACALLAAAPAATPAVDDGLCLGPGSGYDASAERTLRSLTNAFRSSMGLPRLRPKGALTSAARRHSRSMAAGGYFQHSSRGGAFPWAGGRVAGENLAMAQSPEQAMGLLARSPTHRRTLLSRAYTRFGIGAIRTCTGALLITQDFQG
ncbi:MAG: CAP domain-containing protein [Actinomycetota bacterium]